MVAIRPFRALRYNPELAPDLSQVIAPPYDVIGSQEQERLYQASPYNVIRLILGNASAADTEQDNRYTRAQRDFAAWRESRVLREDAAPALYLIRHAYADRGQPRSRLGFIALLNVDESTPRAVYRHEHTLAAPKADRTKLLEAVPASLEPIFCVYPDEQGATQAALEALARQQPPTATGAINGEAVELWAITTPSHIEAIVRTLASTAVLIADGHHRFEVAYASRERYGAVMTYFVSMADPGLVLRPIHRTVAAPAADLPILRELCELAPSRDEAALSRWLEQGEGQGRFGYYDGTTLHEVTVRAEQLARWLMAPPVPLPLAALEVSLLHSLILPRAGGGEVRYTADVAHAIRSVDDGDARSAWLLRGIPLPQVYALAAQGLTMPPKSTYFYPKVPSGLTIHAFTECAGVTKSPRHKVTGDV